MHSTLCRREAAAFQRAARGGKPLLVACTQEARLFAELAEQTEGAPSLQERPIRFLNIRETGGWSRDARAATPKIAALLAAAALPEPDPVATVTYRSGGRVLVIGAADAAERAAALLADRLDVTVLLSDANTHGRLAQAHQWVVHAGRLSALTGWLGAFEAQWEQGNPIDLDLCTRCNACIDACPENAIGFGYQVDLARCASHRECVRVCEAAGAIDFERAPVAASERFDLVLDLRAAPAFTMPTRPQGYFHVASDERALFESVIALRDLTGEFDKPKFFRYERKLCAHSRNEQIGCTACIDVCSAQAIASDATASGGIRVEPHLCVGCGACSTVCPSGAIGHQVPGPAHLGLRLRTLLSTYLGAGGRDAALLLHDAGRGAALIGDLGRAARTDPAVHGVPARVMPLEVWHGASVGLDVWLSAIAFGASQVRVLVTDDVAPDYRAALAAQAAQANAILQGLGYAGQHVAVIEADDVATLDAALQQPPARTVATPAAFAVAADKRTTLELAIEHLRLQAPGLGDGQRPIALPAEGALYGAVHVNADQCTLCLACVGACPENALADNPERPQLRFVEKNCVQCGLCATTCPEDAITLEPRLWLADEGRARRNSRVLNEQEPYRCVACGKPFGTVKAVEAMLTRLSGHAMFQGEAARRLRMCSDCRVVDLFSQREEVKITDLPGGSR